ncbi:MAG TPA: hypothetical protein VGD55_00125 [Acidothermaceae bacterium]
MTSLATYQLCGLRVASELPLHQDRIVEGGGPPDVVLTVGESRPVPTAEPAGVRLAEVVDDAGTRYFSFAKNADGSYVLRSYRIGDFEVSADLSRVVLHLDPNADPGFASVLATGSLLAFLILMRGAPLLHASAVEIEGRALAFVGFSGMGKSTMATIMCAGGATLITDDTLRVDLDGGEVRCFLGATETRLRTSAAELTSAFAVGGAHRHTSDDREALRLAAAHTERLPLAAIVIPQPVKQTEEVVVERLRGAEALLTLSRFPRIVGWEEPTVLQRQFEFLADIVERVPVYIGYLPWGPPFAPDLAVRLLAGIAELPRTQTPVLGSR